MKTEITVTMATCTVAFRNTEGCVVFSKTMQFEIPTRVTDKHDLCETESYVQVERHSYRLTTTAELHSKSRETLDLGGYVDHC
jgi:hypothetical protein